MISSMRSRFRSKKYQPILWIAMFSLVFAASLPELLKRFFGPADWVIKVNGDYVTAEQFSQKIEEEKLNIENLRRQFGPSINTLLASLGNLDPKALAIKDLTNELLLNKSIKKLNIQFHPEFVEHEILKKIPKKIIEEYGTTDLNIISQLMGVPNAKELMKAFEKELKNMLASDLITGAIYIPEFELKNAYNSIFAKKKYSILIFSFDKYLNEAKKTPLTKEEVKNFFDEQNKKEKRYLIPEMRQGIKWEFSPTEYVQITEKDLESYYNKHKRVQFIESPARVKVRRILLNVKDKSEAVKVMQEAKKIHSELVADKSKFVEYVKKYSQDKESADNEGIVNFFSRGQKDKEFETAAFALKNPGDISEPVETKYGVEIIQLIEKKPIEFKKFADIKDKIKADVEKEKFDKLFMTEMKKFAAGTKENSFLEFAKKKGAKDKNIKLITKLDSLVPQKLFEIKNENGLSYYIDDKNSGIAIQLTKIEKTHLPNFEDVYKKIENDLYEHKALQKLKADLKKAREESQTKNFEQLKDQFGATLKTTLWIGQDKESIEKLKKENIPLDKLLELEQEDIVIDAISGNTGFLIKLNHIEPFNVSSYQSKKPMLEKEIMMRRKQELEIGFIDSLRKNAKIETNEKALKQFRGL